MSNDYSDGRDKSIAPKPQTMTQQERDAILILHGKGATPVYIARHLNRAATTIRRVIKTAAKIQDEAPDFKETLKDKAIAAVHAGLDHDVDPYKRGGLGVNVLKGIGLFAPDGAAITINNLVASVPEKWRDRYISNDEGETNGPQ